MKVNSYIAQNPFLWNTQCALLFIPWQTFASKHHLVVTIAKLTVIVLEFKNNYAFIITKQKTIGDHVLFWWLTSIWF